MDSYMTLLDRYEMYQGGYIWDFKDQAIQVTDPITGREVMRYGGDFDDKPSDYEFSGMGSFCRWTRKTRHAGGKILL